LKIPWERPHPCLWASGKDSLIEAIRQGWVALPGFLEEKYEKDFRILDTGRFRAERRDRLRSYENPDDQFGGQDDDEQQEEEQEET
jgi:hypothetical protein